MHTLDGGKALGLDVSGMQDTFANYATRFSWCCLGNLFKGEGQNLTLYVYAVKQWTADLVKVA
jgi:hypothetical protein